MIWVDRYREKNGKVIRPSDKWFEKSFRLTKKAIEEGPDHKVSNHYKDIEVKMALEELFFDKCAYCETKISSSFSLEVEHYRPKGRVAERPDDHPGYYWLAYKWENLYPSCAFCNQRRKDLPRYDDRRILPAQGKFDRFPIENEENRALTPDDDISKEAPLLLDPNNENDDPEFHFTYDIHGQIHPIDKDDRFAVETRRICHLYRRRLRDDRLSTIMFVSRILRLINIAESNNNEESKRDLHYILDLLTRSSAQYAGAARAVVCDPDAYKTTLEE